MMRTKAPLAALLLVAVACNTAPEPQQDDRTGPAPTLAWNGSFPGFYSSMTATTDAPSPGTELWVFPDSGFVLRATPGPDAFPTGVFGKWYVVDDLLATGSGTDKPEFWKRTAEGLLNVGEDGQPFSDGPRMILERVPNAPMDQVPPMRVRGTYRYAANSHSFEPAGSDREFPLAVGDLVGDMLEALSGSSDIKREQLCVEIECSLTPGPAMEGGGTDEYVQLFGLVRSLPANECD